MSTIKNLELVPYDECLGTKLTEGILLQLEGNTLSNCSRYAINLICGKQKKNDIAFHLNPRLTERYVVRNSNINGSWGEEETASPIKFNINDFKKFQIKILTTLDSFMVTVNEHHICSYKFRIPVEYIERLQVTGQLFLKSVQFKKVDFYPFPLKTLDKIPIHCSNSFLNTKSVLSNPLTAMLLNGLTEGHQLVVEGHVKVAPHSFYINLQKGHHIWPHPKIPLHLNVRFLYASGKSAIIKNSWVCGWGKEEVTENKYILPNQDFKVAITKDTDIFQIYANNILIGEYKPRCEPYVDTIYIQGDIFIHKVAVMKQR